MSSDSIHLRSNSYPTLQMSREDLDELREMMAFVDQMKAKLADFFCDEAQTFSLEDCVLTFKLFCEKFKKAIEVNIIWVVYFI